RPPTRPRRTSSPTRRPAAPSGVRSRTDRPVAGAPGGTTRVSCARGAGVAATVVSHSRSAAGERLAPAVTTIGSWHRGLNAIAPAVAPVSSTARRTVVARPSATVGAKKTGVTRSRSARPVFTTSWRRQQSAREASGVLAVLDDEGTVHQHVLDARWVLVRLLVGGAVGDLARIEHDEIGASAHGDDTAIFQPEAAGWQLSHLVDRLGQAQHALLTCVLAQNAR